MQKNRYNFKLALLIILVAIISALVSFYPLLISDKKAAVFNFEPEAAYIANAFKYIYSHKIIFDGHPGTPSIVSVSYALIPLRMYSKLIANMPFFEWAIKNIFAVFIYTRAFQSLLFALGIMVYLKAVYGITGKYLSLIIGWLGLFSFSYFPYLGTIIQSETLSLLILSLWLFVFTKFFKKKSKKLFYLLCIIAGLAFANKLTNIFYIINSLLLVFVFSNLSFKSKIRRGINGSLFTLAAFIFGTWPIRDRYQGLIGWISTLATHSGIHGSGENTAFNPNTYLESIKAITGREFGATIIVLITIGVLFYFIRNKATFVKSSIVIVMSTMFAGMLVFSKYPLIHYQMPLYFAVLFVLTFLSANIYKPLQIILIGVFAIWTINNLKQYYKFMFTEIRGTVIMEEYVINNPPKVANLWEFSKTSDYALIHIRDWSGEPFSTFLHQVRPNLLSLTTNMNKAVLAYDQNVDVFSVCWDQLYIQKTELNRFLTKYPNQNYTIRPIKGSTRDMYILTSDHCIK